jgi:DNA-binding CsgD family transcriptional regulator
MSVLKLPSFSSTAGPEESNNVVNIKGLQKQNLPYIFIWVIYYAWVIVFATWWTASPKTEVVFNTDLRSLMHSLNLLSSAVLVFFVNKERFVRFTKAGAVIVIAGMGIFLAAQNPLLRMLSAVVTGVALGIVNTGILMPFVFALNNTEKMYSVVLSNILINFSLFFQEGGYLDGSKDMLLSFVILVVAFIAVIFFRKDSIAAKSKDEDIPEINSRVYLTLFINCLFAVLCKGAGKGILNITAEQSSGHVLAWYYIGGLAGCLIYFAVYAFSKKSTQLTWNITFGCLTLGLLFNAFISQYEVLALVFSVLLGMGSTIGMINMYYILGVIGKKYNSLLYVRLSILFIGICGGISGVVVGNLINRSNNSGVSIFSSIGSASVMVLFLMLSPVLSKIHYNDEWAADSGKIEIENEQSLFKKYQLSRRETEVCKLLLQGYTLRQISAVLSIAYPTVNTYCTSIYLKLGINSRTELLLRFKDSVN